MEPIYKSKNNQLLKYVLTIFGFVVLGAFVFEIIGKIVVILLGAIAITWLIVGTEINLLIYVDKISYVKNEKFKFNKKTIIFNTEMEFRFLLTNSWTELKVKNDTDYKIFSLANIYDEKTELAYLLSSLVKEGYKVYLKYGPILEPKINDILKDNKLKIIRNDQLVSIA